MGSLASADALVSTTSRVDGISMALLDPGSGSVAWHYADGDGGPLWQAEAWSHVADSLGGAAADYSTTPDGLGFVNASAATALGSGSASVDILNAALSATNTFDIPAGAWANTAPRASMYNFFTIDNTGLGPGPIGVDFSFDYTIHLTGTAGPGGAYLADAAVGMSLMSLDANGDWQGVAGGELFKSAVISGGDGDSDDLLIGGTLSASVELESDQIYTVLYHVDENSRVPTPGTLAVVLAGAALVGTRRRAAG